ncbi:MAG: hypothetical protein HZA51_08055 [Planctomycetes bacterium]|nr:hypothetical protein [Planctomycetota bacterium]
MTGCKRSPRRIVPLVFAILVGALVIANYYETNVKSRKLDEAETKKPFVFLHMTPAFSPVLKCGVIAAVWNDGQIVRARSEGDIGKMYVKGMMSPTDLARIKQLVVQFSPENPNENGIVVDAAADILVVRFKSKIEVKGHSPPNTNDPEITRIRNELMNVAIVNPSEIDGAPYKAHPGDWYK